MTTPRPVTPAATALAAGFAALALTAPAAGAQGVDTGSLGTGSLPVLHGEFPVGTLDPAPSGPGTSGPGTDWDDVARPRAVAERIQAQIDEARRANGLPAVRHDANVDSGAQGWSELMAAEKNFNHAPVVPGECENIYWVSGTPDDVRAPLRATTSWMNSPGHRACLLSPTSTRSGVGVAQTPDGQWYVTYRAYD